MKVQIPNMYLWEEDVEEFYKGKIKREDLYEIARQLSKAMMYDWELVLATIVSDYYRK